jgi:hypothetical protein
LYGQGYQAFDLTPGGHSYKERLANAHDQLFELRITSWWDAFSTKYIYDFLKERSKSIFSGVGVNLKQAKRSFERKLKLGNERFKLFKRGKIGYLSKRSSSVPNNRDGVTTFRIDRIREYGDKGNVLSINSLSDLLEFDAGGGTTTRWEFLEKSALRFENGEQAYTWVEHRRLIACVWKVPENKRSQAGEPSVLKNAIVLEGLYCHAQKLKALPGFLSAVATQLLSGENSSPLYLRVSNTEKTILTTLEEAGFAPESI